VKDQICRINNKVQATGSLDRLRLALLLKDVKENPDKYPSDTNDWLEWLNRRQLG